MVWGGAEEQAAEIQVGNMDTKNWQDKAQEILKTTVHCVQPISNHVHSNF